MNDQNNSDYNDNKFNPYKQMMRNMPKFKVYPPNIPAAVNATDEFLFGWWRFLPSPADDREDKIMRAIVQEVKNRHCYNNDNQSQMRRNYIQNRVPRRYDNNNTPNTGTGTRQY